MSILMAASHPERVSALVCAGGMARSTPDVDYPWGTPKEALVEAGAELVAPHWGEGAMIEVAAPSHANDPAHVNALPSPWRKRARNNVS